MTLLCFSLLNCHSSDGLRQDCLFASLLNVKISNYFHEKATGLMLSFVVFIFTETLPGPAILAILLKSNIGTRYDLKDIP